MNNNSILKDDTKIKVRSLVPAVYYTCVKTMDSFAWEEVGDEQEMTYMQLKYMKAHYPRYFTEKWLMILNDEVLEKLKLSDIFVTEVTPSNMKKFYGSDIEEAQKFILELRDDVKARLVNKIIAAVKKGKIENVKMIRMLENELDTELMQFV